jgi:low temperature requirement protein LtrA
VSGVPAIPWHRPMSGRDPDEQHRASTPLELFFDLSFVVAVAAAAAALHHDIALDHLSGMLGYATSFFAIWWAWVNYSWFASAYDPGDVQFRLLTFGVMTGVLVLAAGVPHAAGEEHDFRVLVVGYVIMRLALVPLWLRVAREHLDFRGTALRYAGGITAIQALWVLRTVLLPHDDAGWVVFGLLVVAELALPYWAEHAQMTPWHRHHIAERYELFTIIVLGEVILATTQAISQAVDAHGLHAQLLMLIIGALLMVFSFWWVYFKRPMVDSLTRETAFVFGYVHYFVFGSAAAVGACLTTLVDVVQGEAPVATRTAVLLLVTFATIYLLVVPGLHSLADRSLATAAPAIVVVVLMWVVALLGLDAGTSVLVLGGVVSLSVADHVRRTSRAAG